MNRGGGPTRWIALAVATAAAAFSAPDLASAAVEESDGRLDRFFSADGFVRTAFFERTSSEGGRDVANAVVVRADGRILVGGQASDGNLQFALARYRRNGALDTAFMSPQGHRAMDVSSKDGGDDSIADLAIQPDGKIVVAGYATPADGGRDLAVARFDSEGDFDPSFGVGGVAITPVGPGNSASEDQAVALAVQPDGRIVLAGSTTGSGAQDSVLARFNPDGAPDPSFSGDGLLRVDLSPGTLADRFVDVAIGPGGAITAVGVAEQAAGRPDIAVARFRPDGSADTSLAGDGTAMLDPFGGADVPSALSLRADGGLFVAGTSSGTGFCDAFAVVSLGPDGNFVSSFGKAGVATTDLSGPCGEEANALAVQPNGKILVGGGNGEPGEFVLMRLTAQGAPDPTLGDDGIVTRPVDGAGSRLDGRDSAIADLAVGRAGSVVVVGSSSADDASSAWTVARFSNPCSLAAARLRATATKSGRAEARLRKARGDLRRARLRREAKRAKARMKRALRTANRACNV